MEVPEKAWTCVHDAISFRGPLLAWQEGYDIRLNQVKRRDIEKLRKEEEEFDRFLEKIEEVSESQVPAFLLKSAYSDLGGIINNIYFLKVGSWIAYYFIDLREQLCAGLLVCREASSFDEKLQMVAQAMKRQR